MMLFMTDLLPILDCDDCGACCFEQGSPPVTCEADMERILAAPPEAARAILLHLAGLDRGEDADGVCCWLDQQTLRCRWYEHRPEICRDFVPGSEGCRAFRADYNIDVQRINSGPG